MFKCLKWAIRSRSWPWFVELAHIFPGAESSSGEDSDGYFFITEGLWQKKTFHVSKVRACCASILRKTSRELIVNYSTITQLPTAAPMQIIRSSPNPWDLLCEGPLSGGGYWFNEQASFPKFSSEFFLLWYASIVICSTSCQQEPICQTLQHGRT